MRYWIQRAQSRRLLSAEQTDDWLNKSESIHRWINSLIKLRRQWLNQIREEPEEYGIEDSEP